MELGNFIFGNSRGNYAIPRETYEEPFLEFLCKNKFNGYGYRKKSRKDVFENDVFLIRPYYWGEEEEISQLPNFLYKPNGFTISWYKYPLRDAYCSQEISLDEFLDMLSHCTESMLKK